MILDGLSRFHYRCGDLVRTQSRIVGYYFFFLPKDELLAKPKGTVMKMKKLSKKDAEEMADLTELSYELHGQNKNCDVEECDVHKTKKMRKK